MKIGAKLITSFLLMGLLIGVVGLVSVATSRDNLQTIIGNNSAVLARGVLKEIESELYERQLDIQLLADSHTARHFLIEISKTGDSLAHPVSGVNESLISFRGRGFNLWNKVFIVGVDRIIEAASDESRVGQVFSSINGVGVEQALAGKIFVSDAFRDPETGKITMVFAAPVHKWSLPSDSKKESSVVGAVVGYFDWENVVGIVKNTEADGQKKRKTMHMKLVNKSGKLLYSTKPFSFFDDISVDMMSEFMDVKAQSVGSDNISYWVGKESEEHEDGEVLFSYAQSEKYKGYLGPDWIIFVEHEISEVFRPVEELKNIILGVSLFSVLLAILIGIFISQSILKSIQRLSMAAKKVASGDLSVSTGIESKDEIGQLARLFDDMTISLRDSQENIEEKVEEQTRNIETQKEKLESQQKAILNILQDVEEEKNETARERDKVDAILHSIGDGVFVVDKKYKITMFNQVAGDISGFTLNEAIGKRYDSVLKFVYEETGKVNDAFIKAAMATGNIQTMSGRTLLVRKDGSRVSVADSAAPIKSGGGEITGCIIVFRDVTQEREIDKMKTEFVSIASHQLRTPLTAIKLFIEMLAGQAVGKLNEKQKDYVENVHRSTERMIGLVNDLLNVSRLETGRLRIKPEPVQIEDFIQEVIDSLSVLAGARNCVLVFSKPDKQLPKIPVDKTLMDQIVRNLISNAVRYSTKKKCQIVITLEREKAGGRDSFIISVKDSGIGIPKSVQPRIFEKFFRADNAQKAEAEGSGLGLYVVKLIVESSGGEIWFDSEEGTGATFYVKIPMEGMKEKEGTRRLASGSKRS